jgi:hypothetical protein
MIAFSIMIMPILFLPVLGIIVSTVYVCYQSRALKHVPGPFLTRYTKLPLLYQTLSLNRTRYIHALHQKYGPLDRLAPAEISINDPPSVGQIYNYEKTHFYNAFEAYGAKNMFSTPDRNGHSWKRKNLGAEYTKTYMLRPENLSMIYNRVRQMVGSIQDGSTVDVFFLFNYMAQDVISGFFFGDKNGSQEWEPPAAKDTEVFDAWHMRRHTFHWWAELPVVAKFMYRSGIAKSLSKWQRRPWMRRRSPRDG